VTAYIVRRLLYAIPMILGTTLLLFVVFNYFGGDPALVLAGKHATPETIATIKRELGLDRPWYVQYFKMLKDMILHFDLGTSYATKERIGDIFARGAVVSFLVTAPAFFLSIAISVVIGMLVAILRGTWVDKGIVAFTVAMQSVSVLVYIIAGQYFLAYKFQWFPIHGYDPSFFGRWEYLMLPMLIIVVLSLAPQIRFYRTIFLDELYQDYVRTARAKGLSQAPVLFKHVLKNAMIPVITDMVISIPFLLLGSLLIESFFGIPGLGSLVVNAIANSYRPVLMAVCIVSTVLFVLFNLLTDICYALFDPRVKVG